MMDSNRSSTRGRIRTLRRPAGIGLRAVAAMGLVWVGLLPVCVQAQITPGQANQLRIGVGQRVEALTILGGDYGLAGGTYDSTNNAPQKFDINVSKFGGAGDVDDPHQLDGLNIGWHPRLQGSMGYVDFKNQLTSPLLNGDLSEFRTFAIQFGGGARLWLNEHFSLAPTIMGMYGHSSNEYIARSAFAVANLARAKQMGIVDYNTDTWTVRPALNLQYVCRWDRTIFTLSSDPTYFHTESFGSSNSNVSVSGNSKSWANTLDVDIPLGQDLFGHELRTGGFLARNELFGGLKDGLNTDHIYEIHGRLVLDFLNQFWKTQWIGIGGSYFLGSNLNGWTFGADIAFRF
jgi:hypothetical protein